jgi:DNA mismatch repair protein MutS2
MIYPGNFEQKIGFDRIRELLRQQCISELAGRHVDSMRFEQGHGRVQELLNQAEEFRQILLSGRSFPNSGYFDLTAEIRRTRPEGTYMETEILFDLRSSLQTINQCLHFLRDDGQELHPALQKLAGDLEPEEELLRQIDRIIDDRGMVRDAASAGLKEIRDDLKRKRLSINGRIKKSMQAAKQAGHAPDEAEVTIRSGRLVIPVLAASKRQVKGFIHDESATGQTVYIEPTEVFDLNNDIRKLENAERREVIRILTAFTDNVRPLAGKLLLMYDFLGMIDFIRAKAKLAMLINGIRPVVKPFPLFNWRNARHPLLYLALKEQGKPVVPMDIELNNRQRILVISGPNAGGKSVCLKTAGLLQYMLQCGLPVPMEENSEAGIFKDIFLDIGDEQSLENDLSTYSSHLINIKFFIRKGNRNTLFLIDEFGTGTEPHLGGAIAEAALHALNRHKAFGIVTTHYANIKHMAGKESGIINGAMLFDTREMRPLYMLKTGKPGSSFAFEIARRIGFPEEVLSHAASITGHSQIDFEKQLQELETEKMLLEKEKEQFGVADGFLSEMIDKYEKLLEELNTRKAQIVEAARNEAENIILGANRLIEKTIKDIREAEAEKEKTRALRKKMEKEAEKIVEKKPGKDVSTAAKKPPEEQSGIYDPGPPSVGDLVEIKTYNTSGELISIKGKTATVAIGALRIRVPLKDLVKLRRSEKEGKKESRKSPAYRSIMHDINRRAANFKPSIDLRGKRAAEALSELQSWLDDAIMLSMKDLSILHGTGDGILRKVIREYLQNIEEIEHFRDAHVEHGGQGITEVRLR